MQIKSTFSKPIFARILLLFSLFAVLAFTLQKPINTPDNPPTTPQYSERVNKLLKEMTLKEKVGQMVQIAIDIIYEGQAYALTQPYRIDRAKLKRAMNEYQVGSILNIPSGTFPDVEEWQKIMTTIHDANAKNRLNIPLLYGIDAIHGVNYCKGATIFPQPLAMAATWNLELAERMAEITAYECRAAGFHWNFSPAMDIGRNPVWPRFWESFGEDVYLNMVMGEAMVNGYQNLQDGTIDKHHVAACLKHFTGYGFPLSGRDRTPAYIPNNYLREYYLPQYQRSIDEGALTIMINSAEVNGVPVHASKRILTDILRKEMGFEGLLVTDWQDIHYLHTRHRIAPDMKTAVRLAVEAGVDMSMVPITFDFADLLIELVEEGSIPMSRIDESVGRILTVKEKLGLFEETLYPLSDYPDFGNANHENASYQSAMESIVLLKNQDNILPLSKSNKILVCGPTANSMRSLNGGWTVNWQGDFAEVHLAKKATILEAIQEEMGNNQVRYVEGVNFEANQTKAGIEEAVKTAAEVDYIVLCLGEDSYTEDFGNIDDLYLPDAQQELAKALAATGKPIILVLTEGRPRIIHKIEADMKGILGAFYPGPEGGRAVASILFGNFNPEGRLPFTYPRYPNALLTYDHKQTEDRMIERSGKSFDPQFHFGHGLSYTEFAYSNLQIEQKQVLAGEKLRVKVDVTNTGKRQGKEVAMLFVRDDYASITPSTRRLRAFQKIFLQPTETKTVQFELPLQDLAFVNEAEKWTLENDTFTVMIGNQQASFELVEKRE